MNIFIGLVEVAGRNRALKYGLEQLGHQVTFLDLSNHRMSYGGETDFFLARKVKLFAGKRRNSNRVFKFFLIPIEFFLRILLFLKVFLKNDVFLYSFGTSFFSFFDYRIIKFFNKKLICQFHGSDSRPAYLDGARLVNSDYSLLKCKNDAEKQKKMIAFIDKYADEIIDIPPQGYFHERPFILRLIVGLPSGPHQNTPVTTLPKPNGRIRILHAPSDRRYKGSDEIKQIISSLSDQYSIDYVEISNLKNDQVIEEIKKADIVIDQLYTDYALTGFPSEAAWFKKPVITCGNSVELWKSLLPKEFLPPTVYCLPKFFKSELEHLLRDKAYREDLGLKMYNFISTTHNPKIVAARYLMVFSGNYPKTWLFDPNKMTEIYGGFFSPTQTVKACVKGIIEHYGDSSLMLDDKPELKSKLVKWAFDEFSRSD